MVIPGILLGLYAQIKLMSVYRKYLEVPADSGLSGAEAARAILDDAGLQDIPVVEVPGELSDHYDPMHRKLALSSENYHGRSLSAVGVAAHESGHALQHKAAYIPLHFRSALVPAMQFANFAYIGISLIGLFTGMFMKFLPIMIAIFAVFTLFQLITMPVEYDASARAKKELVRLGLVSGQERDGISKVLHAAALTYVAALVSSLMQLLHLVMLSRDRD